METIAIAGNTIGRPTNGNQMEGKQGWDLSSKIEGKSSMIEVLVSVQVPFKVFVCFLFEAESNTRALNLSSN